MNWYKRAQQQTERWQWDEDSLYDYHEDQDRVMYDQVYDFNQSKPGERQPWRLIPAARLKKIWMDTARMGFVRDAKGLKMIEDIIKRTEELTEEKLTHIKKNHINSAAEAMQGLGYNDSENVIAATLTSTGMLDTEIIYDLKGQIFEDFAALKYLKPTERFEDLHGLHWLDEYFLNSVSDRKSRGMALLGVPGVGKTHWMKAASNATGPSGAPSAPDNNGWGS